MLWLDCGREEVVVIAKSYRKLQCIPIETRLVFFQLFEVNTDGWTGENKWKQKKVFE